jgi:hypothetical protein
MSFTVDDLRNAVSNAFDYYDEEKIGVLRLEQVGEMINDTLRQMGSIRSVSAYGVSQIIKKIDMKARGNVAKD